MKGDVVADKYIYKIQINIPVETLAGCLVTASYFSLRVKYLLPHIRMSAFNFVHPTQPLVWLEASQDNTINSSGASTCMVSTSLTATDRTKSLLTAWLSPITLCSPSSTLVGTGKLVCFNTHYCPHYLKHCKTKIKQVNEETVWDLTWKCGQNVEVCREWGKNQASHIIMINVTQ